jgi:hypothetical protein
MVCPFHDLALVGQSDKFCAFFYTVDKEDKMKFI